MEMIIRWKGREDNKWKDEESERKDYIRRNGYIRKEN